MVQLQPDITYPESDEQPMADNTKQFRWIVVIKENLEILFADRADVFVADDLLWYPIEGNDALCQAPDVMVVFGRPKGDRGSYQQWKEENIPPQVAFEILSSSNRPSEMSRKFAFYQQYGIEEYYIYDPNDNELVGFQKNGDRFAEISSIDGWISPLLGIRFQLTLDSLEIYTPTGERFLTPVELNYLREQERQRADRAELAQRAATPRLLQMGLTPEQVAEALGIEVEIVRSLS